MLSLLLKTRDQLAMIQNQNHFFQLSCVLHLNKIYTDFKQKKKLCLFGSVVAVAFQSAFRVEMYQNDVFYF